MEILTFLNNAIDIILGLGLFWFALQALSNTGILRAIVYFISFGLLLAIIWVRLNAPDVALAEAGIGAGLTGALFLLAISKINQVKDLKITAPEASLNFRIISALLCLSVGVGLYFAIINLPQDQHLINEVSLQMQNASIANPVTAVLLDFRGYDTMLEVVVLLVALLGVWSLRSKSTAEKQPQNEILNNLSHLLTPVLILVAAYLLWAGADAPGGAFQAGSVLAAIGVLLILSGWNAQLLISGRGLRIILIAGPTVFFIIAIYTLMISSQLLQYPQNQTATLLLILETLATLSIGSTLAALFYAEPPEDSHATNSKKDNSMNGDS